LGQAFKYTLAKQANRVEANLVRRVVYAFSGILSDLMSPVQDPINGRDAYIGCLGEVSNRGT